MRQLIESNNLLFRIFRHLVFWVLAYFVLIELFAYTDTYAKVDYIYTGVFLFSLSIPVYINHLILIPFLLSRKLVFEYILIADLLVFLGSVFNYYLFEDLVDYVIPGYYFISYYNLSEIIIFFVAFLLVTTLLKLSKEWFSLLESKRKIAQIEKEKTEVEMKMLKSHLDPHFLFNSLNVIYSLARKNHENTSDAVIQLSDIMRFITYEARERIIDISDEVALIEKYIALQNYRLEKEANVEFDNQINSKFEIAPLLLLPLVENAYKHGMKGNIQTGWIKISLKLKERKLLFEISNSIGVNQAEQTNEKGSGLDNIRQRLKLIYPGNHKFEIKSEGNVYNAKITIKA